MANYQSQFTGEQIDTAVGKVDDKLDKTGGMLEGRIYPLNDSVSIGTSTNPFKDIYADTVHGNIGEFTSITPKPSTFLTIGTVNNPVGVLYFQTIDGVSGIFSNNVSVDGYDVWHTGNLKIATGESSIGDTGTGKSDTVTISLSSYGFTKRPVVFVNPNSTDLNTWAHVTQATATSFTVVGGRNSTNPGGFGFMWLAVQV